MGYTNYWNRTNKPITKEFVTEVQEIIEDSIRRGISIRGWDGYGAPEISEEGINFNGDAEKNLRCENCYLSNDEDSLGFDCCKTREFPYDATVKKVLEVAKRHGLVDMVDDDGPAEQLTDAEYLEKYR